MYIFLTGNLWVQLFTIYSFMENDIYYLRIFFMNTTNCKIILIFNAYDFNILMQWQLLHLFVQRFVLALHIILQKSIIFILYFLVYSSWMLNCSRLFVTNEMCIHIDIIVFCPLHFKNISTSKYTGCRPLPERIYVFVYILFVMV